jgi:DNA-binding protein
MSDHPKNTQGQYTRVAKEKEKTAENEIRITASGIASRCIGYALYVLNEKKLDTIVIKASGQAISKACIVAEVLRQRIAGLALISKITNTKFTDIYKPKEQGLDEVKVEKTLAVLELTLKTKPTSEDEKLPGYNAPLSEEERKKVKSIYRNILKFFFFFSWKEKDHKEKEKVKADLEDPEAEEEVVVAQEETVDTEALEDPPLILVKKEKKEIEKNTKKGYL